MSTEGPDDRPVTVTPETETAPAAGAELRALADEFWDGYLEASPIFATVLGDRRFDDRLDDPSPAATARVLRWLDTVVDRAGAIDPTSLGSMERVTRQMLIDEAEGQALSLRTRIDER